MASVSEAEQKRAQVHQALKNAQDETSANALQRQRVGSGEEDAGNNKAITNIAIMMSAIHVINRAALYVKIAPVISVTRILL